MLNGFKQFLLRGNVVDLAVAVVIGAAFGDVVAALVKDLLTPLIAAIVGQPDFSAIQFTINGSRFLIGDFVNAIVSFVLVAAAIYFFVVAPMNMVIARRRSMAPPADPTTKKCPECLSEVPIAARRCAFCAQPLEVAGPRALRANGCRGRILCTASQLEESTPVPPGPGAAKGTCPAEAPLPSIHGECKPAVT